MFDKFREECGVFGIYGHEDAARLAYLGLYALQHRGQESAGIVSSNGEKLFAERGMGQVNDVFTEPVLTRLPGQLAIGHVRYSTAGKVSINEAPRRGRSSRQMAQSSLRPPTRRSFCTGSPAQRAVTSSRRSPRRWRGMKGHSRCSLRLRIGSSPSVTRADSVRSAWGG